jgi:hypothetical protein
MTAINPFNDMSAGIYFMKTDLNHCFLSAKKGSLKHEKLSFHSFSLFGNVAFFN